MAATDRWPAILSILSADRWTRAEDIADALDVSIRTVYRDMNTLVEAGAPVASIPGQGYRLDSERVHSRIRLTDDERLALTVGAAWGAVQLSGRWQAAAYSVQADLAATLPEPMQREAEALIETHVTKPAQAPPPATTSQRLRAAIEAEQTVQVERADTDPFRFDPYALVRVGTDWQVVGHAHASGRVQHIPLTDIASLTPTDATFERPSGYATSPPPHPVAKDAVHVRFDPEIAEAVEVPDAITVVAREETLQGLRMTLQVANEHDVLPWLLSWGPQVHVEAPTTLCDRLAETAQRIADQYPAAPTLLS